jgi:hypothetical protein
MLSGRSSSAALTSRAARLVARRHAIPNAGYQASASQPGAATGMAASGIEAAV